MNGELVGIMALIAAEHARIEAMKLQNSLDQQYDRPLSNSPEDFWRSAEVLDSLYVRVFNVGC